MGKNTILIKEQKSILDLISKNQYLKSNFYFTGGTALSEIYLQHRLSEDIDLLMILVI
jgi:predicted nucleotidyltransferase component of viral defense system